MRLSGCVARFLGVAGAVGAGASIERAVGRLRPFVGRERGARSAERDHFFLEVGSVVRRLELIKK